MGKKKSSIAELRTIHILLQSLFLAQFNCNEAVVGGRGADFFLRAKERMVLELFTVGYFFLKRFNLWPPCCVSTSNHRELG